MRLLRDLWATSPRRTAVVACLIVLGAGGQAAAAALAGPVLVHRSTALFVGARRRAASRPWSATSRSGCIMARLTADWAADVRRRLCRVAFGQDLPTLETTPVGELLDRIDGDVYQVGLRAARQRRADRPVARRRPAVDRHRARGLVAGRRRHAGAGAVLLVAGAARPDPPDRPGPDGRGGGLVRPGRGDGGVDPRPGRRAHQPGPAVRAAPVRPAGQPGARPRPAGLGAVGPGRRDRRPA